MFSIENKYKYAFYFQKGICGGFDFLKGKERGRDEKKEPLVITFFFLFFFSKEVLKIFYRTAGVVYKQGFKRRLMGIIQESGQLG